MNLGSYIDALRPFAGPDDAYYVVFDDGSKPTKLDSWRGVYSQLALGYEPVDLHTALGGVSVAGTLASDLLHDAEYANGRVYEGWKGGEFTMGLGTPVWVSRRGEWEQRIITKIEKSIQTFGNPSYVVIHTLDISDYA